MVRRRPEGEMMKTERHTFTIIFALVALLTAGAFALNSCTPGSGVSVEESDVIVTLFNDTTDFGALNTYVLVDSIVHVPEDNQNLDRTHDDEIIDLVDSLLTRRGYTKTDTIATPNPDFYVLFYATAQQNWFLTGIYPGGGWGWWGWPGGGWGWPGYGASYAFTTGTLAVTLISPGVADSTTVTVPYWTATMNGVLNDTAAGVEARLERGINQMFEQSPYLQSDP